MKIIKILVISFIGLSLTYGLFQVNIFKSLENKLYDSLFYFREPLEDKGRDVVIVAIDEESVMKIGTWPWRRSKLAELISRIKEGNPKVIGIDLLLDVPTRGEKGIEEDKKLAEALGVPPVCVIPTVLEEDDDGGVREVLFAPLDIFLNEYTRCGAVNLYCDPVDKTVRDFRPIYAGEHLSYPLAVCLEYLGIGADALKKEGSFVKFDRYSIPIYNSQTLINYKCTKIDNISACHVLDPSFNPGFSFDGKIVLVGRTDEAAKDFVNTSVPSRKIFETLSMNGVEVWKEVIDMVLQEKFLYKISAVSLLCIMLSLSIAVSGITYYSNKIGAAIMLFILAVWAFVFYGLFLKQSLVIPLLHIASVCIITYLLAFLYNYSVYLRERNMITAAFKSYVSPRILQEILSKKINLKVGGKRKKLAILFADIKGFTDFADAQEPEEVLDYLKTYFSEMNKVITGHNGIIDKLMGDGILAYFGNFSDKDDYAMDAVKAAVEIQEKAPKLQERLGINLIIRIGINTGYITVGNIGSDAHLDYTVIGKNVNLAQRLESSCEPGKILISDSTYQMVKDKINVTGFREISLKGFARPVKVYEVAGLKSNS